MPNKGYNKGENITVDPIPSTGHVKAIKALLKDRPRDLLLFTMGINSGLRMVDLLKLKVTHVQGLKVGGVVSIKEQKTKKANYLVINKAIAAALRKYNRAYPGLPVGRYLFTSRKGQNMPIQSARAGHLVRDWCRGVGLTGNYGCHTLRKTFGFLQRTEHNVGYEILCKRYRHSSPEITMRYLGIKDAEVLNILHNVI